MAADMPDQVIVMLKYPRPGAVKTRLQESLGAAGACELYRGLVRHTLETVAQFSARGRTQPAVEARLADAPDDEATRAWLGAGLSIRPQGEGDLGQRLERAVGEAFTAGASAVVVIGADCPQLTPEHLSSAFRLLNEADLVLGPAEDGGYYLIGLRRFVPELFRGISWGSEQVLAQTLAIAREHRIACRLLETLRDVDRAEDLPVWAQTATAQAGGQGRISVIIPAHNEESCLTQAIESARCGQPREMIVVDGGSADQTAALARGRGAIVLSARRCRAAQMNTGAAVATGEYLLFLHADTLLPPGYGERVRRLLGEPGVVAGAFTFAVAANFRGRKWVEVTTNWRARRWQLPYGDQALFLRRETFKQLGGFPDLPIMEDYELVRRLRRLGRIAIDAAPAITSGRRWQRLGMLRTTLINRAVILGYRLGVAPARLAQWYGSLSFRPAPPARLRPGAAGEAPVLAAARFGERSQPHSEL